MRSNRFFAIIPSWWVVVAVAMLIMGGAVLQVRPTVDYYSDVHVLFYAPQTEYSPLLLTDYQAIALAGIVQLSVTGSQSGAHTSSDSVTLQGEGVYDGFSILLPNSGGQWSNEFIHPELDVQVTGHDPAVVTRRMAAIVAQITSTARTLQSDAGSSPQHMVSTTAIPAVIDVYSASGSRPRAQVAILILGFGLMITILKRLGSRRLRSDAARSEPAVADLPIGGWNVRARPEPEAVH